MFGGFSRYFFFLLLYRQQMNSTLTVNRQIGQKQNGLIHLFNLVLRNVPIDFIPVPMTLGIAEQTERRAELARAIPR